MEVEHTIFRNGNLFCTHCGVESVMTLPMPIDKWGNWIKAFNKKHAKCEKTWVEPVADMSLSEIERIDWWLKNGDRGNSSETMLCICYNRTLVEMTFDTPHDPSDFYRCYKLVEAVPEIKDKFYLLANTSNKWKVIIDKWDSLCVLLNDLIATKKDNGLYDFLQSI